MIELGTLKVSQELYNIIDQICKFTETKTPESVFKDIEYLADLYNKDFNLFLKERNNIQAEINDFFEAFSGKDAPQKIIVDYFKDLDYIKMPNTYDQDIKVETKNLPEEIAPLSGSQLVVPADKINMVLNAANARWGSLYDAFYASNIIEEKIIDNAKRKAEAKELTDNFCNEILPFKENNWQNAVSFAFDEESKQIYALDQNGKKINFNQDSVEKIIGIIINENVLNSFIAKNNNLHIRFDLNNEGKLVDIQLEAALTYIIDLEDSSISTPICKYQSYLNILGIVKKDLSCIVRGTERKLNDDESYQDIKTFENKILKKTALALVRDVGMHMMTDKEMININDKPIYERILDCYITSLIGIRYHVAPKLHGVFEVISNCELLKTIDDLQNLPEYSNKIGIMNEECRTNAQLEMCVMKAKDRIFFTNTGFLDYTGSFIDFMMYRGAIVPYRNLSTQKYKTLYEKNNVYIGLKRKVPQIGAGMWAKIKDMKNLIISKIEQIESGTDTSWAPSPAASVIHSYAFHKTNNARKIQQELEQEIKSAPSFEDMFEFPMLDASKISKSEIKENLDFAIHGLIAYAEPWVRKSIGCSGIKDLSGELLMEDRATARIKAAFVRNWLLHKIISEKDVVDSIKNMAQFVDEQNLETQDYKKLYDENLKSEDWDNTDETIKAVKDLVFNILNLKFSYVEPYLYPANRRYFTKKQTY